jgi:glucan phosphoethanolaminetransferase (alkaline phosphatase superfamily)
MPDEQVAYGHPWVVAFTLLFKVRISAPIALYSALSLPYFLAFSAVVIVFAAQVASVVVYMVCGLFSSGFITNFVVVTILLMLDFWTVRVSLLCLTVASFLSCCFLPARSMRAPSANPRKASATVCFGHYC